MARRASRASPTSAMIDASWHLPPTGPQRRGGISRAAYSRRRVLQHRRDRRHRRAACRTCCRTRTPSRRAMTALGLGDGMRFVVYDTLGLFAAARVWWTLRAFGVERREDPRRRPAQMAARGPADRDRRGASASRGRSRRGSTTASSPALEDVRKALASGSAQVVDARPADRFEGRAPEPRPGLKSGHMPGSLNLPFVEIVEHGHLKSARSARRRLRRARRRSEEAGHHHLRLRRQRRDPRARGRGSGRPGRRALRRLVGGMGRQSRLPGRDGAGEKIGRASTSPASPSRCRSGAQPRRSCGDYRAECAVSAIDGDNAGKARLKRTI